MAICTVLYIAVSLILTGVVPYTKLSVPHPIALGVEATGQRWLATAVEIGAIAGLSSVMLVMLLGQPRIFFAMANDGLLPSAAAKIHPRFGIPYITTIVTGVVCAVAGGVLPIDILAELTSIGTLFAFVLVSLGVMILRLRRPELERAFRVPGGSGRGAGPGGTHVGNSDVHRHNRDDHSAICVDGDWARDLFRL